MKPISVKPDTVLLKPHITEKAAISAATRNVYVFDVKRDATKKAIVASIKSLYKVTPERVHMLSIPKKATFRRGVKGVKGGGKKAYIHLKKGDKIDII